MSTLTMLYLPNNGRHSMRRHLETSTASYNGPHEILAREGSITLSVLTANRTASLYCLKPAYCETAQHAFKQLLTYTPINTPVPSQHLLLCHLLPHTPALPVHRQTTVWMPRTLAQHTLPTTFINLSLRWMWRSRMLTLDLWVTDNR